MTRGAQGAGSLANWGESADNFEDFVPAADVEAVHRDLLERLTPRQRAELARLLLETSA
jgi:hypothetical protein